MDHDDTGPGASPDDIATAHRMLAIHEHCAALRAQLADIEREVAVIEQAGGDDAQQRVRALAERLVMVAMPTPTMARCKTCVHWAPYTVRFPTRPADADERAGGFCQSTKLA